jgi:hypothetical protein
MGFLTCLRLPDAAPGARRSSYPSQCSCPIVNRRDSVILLAAQEQLERRLRWNQISMVFGLVLGTAAVAAATLEAESFARWSLLTAALLELGGVPWYMRVSRRRLQGVIALIGCDLKNGDAGVGQARVRTILGVWRVLQDVRTGKMQMGSSLIAELDDLQTGSDVVYRFGLRSGIVLGIEGDAEGRREGPGKERHDQCRAVSGDMPQSSPGSNAKWKTFTVNTSCLVAEMRSGI